MKVLFALKFLEQVTMRLQTKNTEFSKAIIVFILAENE